MRLWSSIHIRNQSEFEKWYWSLASELVTSEVTIPGILGGTVIAGTAELTSAAGLVVIEGVVSGLTLGNTGGCPWNSVAGLFRMGDQ